MPASQQAALLGIQRRVGVSREGAASASAWLGGGLGARAGLDVMRLAVAQVQVVSLPPDGHTCTLSHIEQRL